ncbi:transcriptional regulator with XRE-family HTH domain [Rhodopirellula rubra]|uniref:Transcriptional regulator with XRE-family HTH domain n=1 Tax=Aporhodopirellula rubra TaxID=980271 RepID=A0A7W5DWM8_9BACT|nr:hypothetical protein [Aporhodopirellula rubra]MBB3205519.1 transcriptional regulator with XRE-family HTH domain [Aporhodopirellula rubra]
MSDDDFDDGGDEDGWSFSMDFDDDIQLGFNKTMSEELPGEPVIRIYAAGPLTNNDETANGECDEVRSILQRVFADYDYLGVQFEIYHPGEVTMPGSNHSAENVYVINYEQCVLADLVVFNVTQPSLGVGCESQIAADATVPRVVLAKIGSKVSRMFEGEFSTTLATIKYENRQDLELQLIQRREEICGAILESAIRRRPMLNDTSHQKIGQTILRQRILHGVTLDELAQRTDCKASWIHELEKNPRLALASSLMSLFRIAAEISCTVQCASPSPPKLVPNDTPMSVSESESLSNLVHYVLASDGRISEQRAFSLWHDFTEDMKEQSLEAVEYREGYDEALTVEDWRQRDGAGGLF